MENVLLIILLLLALALIGVVLLQRSEGGGLGMGGGGGPAGARSGATALTKLTWVFGVCFMVCALGITVLAARNAEGTSVIDRVGGTAPTAEAPVADGEINTDALLPPPTVDDAGVPLAPKAD